MRTAIKTLKAYSLEDVFDMIKHLDHSKPFVPLIIDGKTQKINLGVNRLHVFLNSTKCACCGLEGTFFLLQQLPKEIDGGTAHFNMYALEDNQMVLMTVDHVLAKNNGGLDNISNMQTMCEVCNQLKSDLDVPKSVVLEARDIYKSRLAHESKSLRDAIYWIHHKAALLGNDMSTAGEWMNKFLGLNTKAGKERLQKITNKREKQRK